MSEEKLAHWFFTKSNNARRPKPGVGDKALRARYLKKRAKSRWFQKYAAARRENEMLRRLIANYVKLRNSPTPSHVLRCTVAQLAVATKVKL